MISLLISLEANTIVENTWIWPQNKVIFLSDILIIVVWLLNRFNY